jgi:rare lipoprotein A (peptidoglycan hydrolase)
MGKSIHAHEFNAYDEENSYLSQSVWITYQQSQEGSNSENQDVLYSELSDTIVANNGTHFNKEELVVAERHFPAACYFIVRVNLDNDVNVVTHLIRNNTDETFRTLTYF